MQKPEATMPPVANSSSLSQPAPAISVANTQSIAVHPKDALIVHAIPTLDGFGLLIMSLLLGAAAFWIWRRQQ